MSNKEKFKTFSKKQMAVLTWWCKKSPYKNKTAIICDGAVRSGKTLCMSLSFVFWSMSSFNGESFAFCGKTIASLRRNVITPLLGVLSSMGIASKEKISKNYIDIKIGNKQNRYYLFSGKDEASAALIQGMTLAGVMFDEVALMPRSFTEQALARCSVEGAKFWFNCNPENPYHWFYINWILKSKEKNTLYLHFTMEDNPSLSKKVKERYKNLYSGKFFERFILGKWVANEGIIYTMFDEKKHVVNDVPVCEKFYLSCDYGTKNPFSVGLWGVFEEKMYRIDEVYYNSVLEGEQKTDEEYYQMLKKLAKNRKIEKIFIDPSAASFIQCIKRHNDFEVESADNDVILGIKTVSQLIKDNKIFIHKRCENILKEFCLYSWKQNSEKDTPIKENDHAMDEMRYFVMSLKKEPKCEGFGIFASVKR